MTFSFPVYLLRDRQLLLRFLLFSTKKPWEQKPSHHLGANVNPESGCTEYSPHPLFLMKSKAPQVRRKH